MLRNKKVLKDYKLELCIGSHGHGKGQLSSPWDVAVSSADGHVYVAGAEQCSTYYTLRYTSMTPHVLQIGETIAFRLFL